MTDLYPVKDPKGQPPTILFILVLIGILIVAWVMLSCNVIKAKRSTRATTDSVSSRKTAAVDTSSGGSVSRGTSKETFDWSKLTLQYPPGDTNITNIYNYPQRPATVIYETGKGSKEESRSDSAYWQNAFSLMQSQQDSLHRELVEMRKDKETRPSIWLFVGIVAAGLVLYGVVSGFLKKYHLFVKK